MTLSEKQRAFAKDVGKLILWAFENGLELTFGEALRTKEQQDIYIRTGKSKTSNSRHLVRLAVDFNLFKDGVYQTRTEDYAALGKYWKSLSPENVWGGDWVSPRDGNHFERRP